MNDLDQPTLRLQFDQLLRDRDEFARVLDEKQRTSEAILKEIEQYRGALSYIEMAGQRLQKELAPVTTPSA